MALSGYSARALSRPSRRSLLIVWSSGTASRFGASPCLSWLDDLGLIAV